MMLRAGLIALAVAASALSGCGGQDPATSASSPTLSRAGTSEARTESSASAVTGQKEQPPVEETEVDEFRAFRSPSGNVGCMVDVDYVRCDISERDWSPPPRPADCEFDYGQGITLVPGGSAEFVCAGDTALAPDASPLPYGESVDVGPVRCDSAESGITCRDTETGHGFTISREAYDIF